MSRANRNIAIVGCGWLGESLAEFYLEKGEQVFGTTRTPSKATELKKLGVTPFLLNSFDDDLSWLSSSDVLVLNMPPSSFGNDYARFMEHVVHHVGPQTNVVFISSTSVYDNRNTLIDESEMSLGNSSRGKNVFEAEKALKSALANRLTIIRMAGLVGKGRHPVKFMSGKTYAGKREPINLIHLEDCLGLIEAVIDKGFWGETLNGCASEHPFKEDYYSWAAKQFHITPPIFTSEEMAHKCVDNKKSKHILGYNYVYDTPYNFPHDK